jgi:hypothetical protein
MPAAESQDGFAFVSASSTSIIAAITLGIAVMTPPRSGPFCRADCFQYPFDDVAGRFPRDYWWMAPACLLFVCYLAMMVAIHVRTAGRRRQLSLLGLALATMAALTLIADYYLQLAAVQPSLIAGERDGVAMLSQYNPHGVFIALEELGYLLMAASLLLVAPCVIRSARYVFVGGAILDAALLAVIAGRYGPAREYRFEVAVISVNFVMLIAGAALLAIEYRPRRALRTGRSSD